MADRPLRALAQNYADGDLDYAAYRLQRGELLHALAKESYANHDTTQRSNPTILSVTHPRIDNSFNEPRATFPAKPLPWFFSKRILLLLFLWVIWLYIFFNQSSSS